MSTAPGVPGSPTPTTGPSVAPGGTPGGDAGASTAPAPRRVRVQHLREAKEAGRRLTMLTAYDAATARIFDASGVDMLLVGDSMGDNMLGHATTIPVTMDELIPAVRAVSRVARRALVVADLPFGSYEASPQHAHAAAVRMLKEGGANAVKLEGGRRIAAHVELLTGAGIPVVGHLGLTPQAENILGGKRVQGRGNDAADALLADAVALAEAGAVAIVLEMIPEGLAQRVTDRLAIPTIGIGAGAACDGQVLVWLDMAGMTDWSPRFARKFGDVGAALAQATGAYVSAVHDGTFPGPEHTYQS